MSAIESYIEGSKKLTDIFGYWPSFHDGEVIELHLWRGDIEPEKKRYVFPALTVTLHHWELTREVNPQGYFVLRHHTLTTMRFHDVFEFKMNAFNDQNAISGLQITRHERNEGPSPFFVVEFQPAFGMDASFQCLRIEVADARPCAEDGRLQ